MSRARNMKAGVLYLQGRYKEALAAANEAISLDEATGWEWRNKTLFQMGRDAEALESLCRQRDDWNALWPQVSAAMSDEGIAAALGVMLYATRGMARTSNYPCWRAAWHVQRGDLDFALDELEAGLALDPPPFNLIYLGVDPQLQPLHGNPRFSRILARVGVPNADRSLSTRVFE
jgi:tetratricopeptide (TPR) repeat protein